MASDGKPGLEDYLLMRKDLGHISIVPTLDGKKWRASFKRQGETHYTVHEHENVVIALMLAISPKKGETVEGLQDDIDNWLGILAEAERKRKQPYPHQTTDELVEKLPEKVRTRRRERTKQAPKDDGGYDLI